MNKYELFVWEACGKPMHEITKILDESAFEVESIRTKITLTHVLKLLLQQYDDATVAYNDMYDSFVMIVHDKDKACMVYWRAETANGDALLFRDQDETEQQQICKLIGWQE